MRHWTYSELSEVVERQYRNALAECKTEEEKFFGPNLDTEEYQLKMEFYEWCRGKEGRWTELMDRHRNPNDYEKEVPDDYTVNWIPNEAASNRIFEEFITKKCDYFDDEEWDEILNE